MHPDDAAAQQVGYPRGKTECWYVLDSESGAQLALGLDPGVTPDQIRAAIADQTLEERMQWIPVHPGEMYFVDAGTVHGIGPGMTLLETQQTCDITYRIYDYGRPRPLHIEDALRVMRAHTRAGRVAPCETPAFTRLIHEQYFTVDRFDLAAAQPTTIASMPVPQILVALTSGVTLTTADASLDITPGRAVIVPAASHAASVHATQAAELIRAFPGQTAAH